MTLIKTMDLLSALIVIATCTGCPNWARSQNPGEQIPSNDNYVSQTPTQFEVDPDWPKPLPHNWLLGEVPGVAVDANDHVWILQRPHSLSDRETAAAQNPPESECCIPAPSVIEFDPEGNVVQAWGNPDTSQQWFAYEHGLFVDNDGNVWVGGNSEDDQVVLKLSNEGELLLKIGEWGITGGSGDTGHLGKPADIAVDLDANEVYIADGYGNRRVIIFDSETGEYKRHWGAYGEAPHDKELPAYDPNAPPTRSFRNPVHAVRISDDNLVYTADRVNDRVQVFQKDGTFVAESLIATETLGAGSVWDIEFSTDSEQTYAYVADAMNRKVWILERKNLKVVGSFGHGGRNAGYFGWVHNIAMDSQGNLYTGEVIPGSRLQRFRPVAD